MLLNAQKIIFPWTKLFEFYLIGNFFNLALPGAISGDLLKVYYINKSHPGIKTKAFGSVLMDKISGLFGCLLLAITAALFQWSQNTTEHSIFFTFIGYCGGILFGGLVYLLWVPISKDPLCKMLEFFSKKISFFQFFFHFYLSLKEYRKYRLKIFQGILLSVFIHFGVSLSCFQFAKILSASLPLIAVLMIVPLGTLANAFPLTPFGLGTGNFAFYYFFHLYESPLGGDIYNLLTFFHTSTGLIGAFLYLRILFFHKKPGH
jgi:uncharacterized membrane protein YbhN (UPF0104 family)